MSLGELAAEEVEVLVATTVASFIDDLVSSGIGRDAAENAVAAQMMRLLPDRAGSSGHQFRSIDDRGRTIGRLWYGPVTESSNDRYLFEIDIDEVERGRGAGRWALQAVISELDNSNVVRLGLNVSQSNTAAVALYESLGFKAGHANESGTEMWLDLNPSR